MLRIAVVLFLLTLSLNSYAQEVPAFLRAEAQQNPQTLPASMQGGNNPGSEPAFLQQERLEQQQQQQQYQQQLQQINAQQNQYQYQSAAPDATTTNVMPPAIYQPAPGDVPAFMQQEQQQIQAQQQQQQMPQQTEPASMQNQADIKTNQKEDVIQINFSDDQYKQEDEVTPLNSDQAKQYNTQVQQQNAPEKNPTTELKEGAVYTPPENTARKQDEKAALAAKNTVPEPEKATTNLLRINFNKDEKELSDADKKALLSTVMSLKTDKTQRILIKSYTSNRETGADTRRIGLLRVINIRDYLMKQGIDFSRTDVNIVGPELNKEDLDYIDIDKI